MKSGTKKIVLVGGGFAGLNFIKSISDDERYEITLVDTNNYHFFPPLLYQVASSFIEASNISHPFRKLFQGKNNLRFHLGSLQRINRESNTINTDTGTLAYDYLILAVGTESNYFGMENVKKYALPMKTINDALILRNHLLLNMEKAVRTNDEKEREALLNIVIAGGGPTGVEIAGMLAEMGINIAAKEYPEFTNVRSKIHLLDASPVLLGPMSRKSQIEAEAVLKSLGVKIILNTAVKDYTDGNVILGNGEKISSRSLIWTSGVTGRELPGLPEESIDRGRRVWVDENNKVLQTENIFAIGDISLSMSDPGYPNGHPQLAQVAIQQGLLLASNFKRMARGKSLESFRYRNKGSMAIISKYKAVADLPGLFFKGVIAWMVWLFIHIMPIAGFRNKVKLFLNWFWAFITNDPTLRLIIRPRRDE